MHRGNLLRRGAVAVTMVGVLLAGSGCSLLARSEAAPPAATATPTPDPVPLAEQLPYHPSAGEVLATGTLVAIDHDPSDDPAALHPLTGAVRIVVNEALEPEVRIRPDAGVPVAEIHPLLMLTTDRFDGGPATMQFALAAVQDRPDKPLVVGDDGEIALPVVTSIPDLGEISYYRSLQVTVADGPTVAAAVLTWVAPPVFPGLKPVDGGAFTFANGRTIVEDGVLTGYVPNPYDTLYAVSKRFGISEVQLVWLNAWMGYTDPQLKAGIGLNLDPARR